MRGANWVGDAVMTVAALRELRRLLPRARVTLATRPWAEGIFEGADFIDDLLITRETSSKPRSVIAEAREWRARRFDLAVLFPNAFAPALVAALARVPARLGYATQGRSALLTHRLPVPVWRGQRHEVFYYLNLVAELERLLYGTSTVEEREPDTHLSVPEAKRERGARDPARLRRSPRQRRSSRSAPARPTAAPSAGRPSASPPSRICLKTRAPKSCSSARARSWTSPKRSRVKCACAPSC